MPPVNIGHSSHINALVKHYSIGHVPSCRSLLMLEYRALPVWCTCVISHWLQCVPSVWTQNSNKYFMCLPSRCQNSLSYWWVFHLVKYLQLWRPVVAKWCHMVFSALVIIASGNGLLPSGTKRLPKTKLCYCQQEPVGTNFSKIYNKMENILLKKMHFDLLSVKWQPFYSGLNV